MKLLNIAAAAAGIALMMLATSCTTPKKVTYFQDITDGMQIVPSQQYDIKVKPDDKLSILVTTPDPALSALFNLVQAQNRLGSTTTATTTVPTVGYQQGYVSYYTVSPQGDINFPMLGKIHIAGMTRSQVAEHLERELQSRELVKDPVVTVEYTNTGISVLGDVVRPGRYEFNKDHLSILDALAMAGDLQTTGQRENVIVMRDDGKGGQTAYRIDLTDMKNVASSPVYYLQQNDVIYVEPNDKKKRETASVGNAPFQPSFWVSVGSVAVSIATLIITISK